jgi:hypothetical protein
MDIVIGPGVAVDDNIIRIIRGFGRHLRGHGEGKKKNAKCGAKGSEGFQETAAFRGLRHRPTVYI